MKYRFRYACRVHDLHIPLVLVEKMEGFRSDNLFVYLVESSRIIAGILSPNVMPSAT